MATTHSVLSTVGHIFETTDATESTAVNIPTNTDEAYYVWLIVVAVDTSDFSQVAGYQRSGLFKNDGGTLSNVDTVNTDQSDATDGAWAVTMDTSGTNIRVRVTGEAGKTITWRIVPHVYPVGTASTPFNV